MPSITLPDSISVTVPAVNKAFSLDLIKIDASVIEHLVAHGLKQKLGDSVAGMSGESQADRIKTMEEVFARIIKGEFRSSGGGRRLSFEDRAERQVLARYFKNYPAFKKADAADKAAKRDDAWATLARLAGTDEAMVRETLAPQIAKVASNLKAAEEDVTVDLGGLKV